MYIHMHIHTYAQVLHLWDWVEQDLIELGIQALDPTIYIYTYMYTCIYTCMYTCMYTYMYTYIYTYIYMHTCIYTGIKALDPTIFAAADYKHVSTSQLQHSLLKVYHIPYAYAYTYADYKHVSTSQLQHSLLKV